MERTLRFVILRTACWLVVAAACGSTRADVATLWTFDNPLDRFAPAFGPGQMSYFDPSATGWGPQLTQFGTASSFDLPTMSDGLGGWADPNVMRFPATAPSQGYVVRHFAPPNGVHQDNGWVSNYTLVWDILWPAASDGAWRSFYQTNTSNANDGELFALNASGGGIGISGRYHGSLRPDTWHRVAVTVRAADGEGQLHKFIDGHFVGGQGTTGSAISSRWTLDPTFLLFADENNETRAGYVSSFYFVDRQLTMDEVRALGGPNASGAAIPGNPPPISLSTDRRVDIIGHRGNSCCAPENTLAAIDQAFQLGATRIEIDIRRSADGHAVLMHDATLDRTTNGTGSVAAQTLAQLKQLDAGSWFDARYAGEPVPSLADAMQLAKGRGTLYLDLKLTGLGPAIAAAVAETNFPVDDLWLWNYNSTSEAAQLRASVPGAKIIWGQIAGWDSDPNFFTNLKAIGVWGFDIGAGNGNVSPAFVQAAHAHGMYVAVFTILDPDAMRLAIANGVDAVETDFVEHLDAIMPRPGDVNLDGRVDRVDAALLAANYGRRLDALWQHGNFGLPYIDRDVGLIDVLLLRNNLGWGAAGTQQMAAVPEPPSWCLVAVAVMVLIGRSRSRWRAEPAEKRPRK